MYKQHAEWKARADECRREAQAAMKAALNESNEESKAEALLIATEMLKLADEIEQRLASGGRTESLVH